MKMFLAKKLPRYKLFYLISLFQQKFDKFNISEVIKGGSLGHGTAVPGHYDIDLVIYSRGIYPILLSYA